MTLIKHELRQGKFSFLIWTGGIGFLLAVCIFLFPEMKDQMGEIGNMFSSMGAFTAAFGMDKLNFGTFTGFYAVECGNILGLGGAFFSSLCAVSILSKEENGRTAEFLLAHPVSRRRIVTEKLLAVFVQIIAMNLVIYGLACVSTAIVGGDVLWKEFNLLHLAYLLMQFELAGITFGISAFMRKSSAGVGLGIAAVMYFLNLVANIAESAEFLKYITPFGYSDGTDIVAAGALDLPMTVIGLGVGAAGVAAAYLKYCGKDIQA